MSREPDPAELARLVEQAAALPVGERDSFLDSACGDDADLRARVIERLAGSGREPAGPGAAPDPTAETLLREPHSDDEDPTLLAPSDGGPLPPARDPYGLTGTTIGHYEVRERLARGGMGVVYKAHDRALDREVALKFILLSLSADAHVRQRFLAEARTASSLDHKNICTIHEVGQTASGQIYLAMSYYRGETLAQKIVRGALPAREALDYGVQIASGLAVAHAKGILHRDVKPANVMITEPGPAERHGTAKILDFGLAKMEELQLTRSGAKVGTLAYMSPEQARGEKVDERSDIWAVGVILYEMLTGERPFKADGEAATLHAILNDVPPPVGERVADLPDGLEKVVSRCLERDRKRRYESMAALLKELRELQLAAAGYSATGISGVPAPVGRHRAVGIAGAVAALLVLVALLVPASRRQLLGPLAGPSTAPKHLVAVLPFVNSLGESDENRALADGLTHSIAGLLASLGTVDPSLWVVPATEIVQAGVETAGDAHKLFGVDRVLTGAVQRPRSITEITLTVVDPTRTPPRSLGSQTTRAPLNPALRESALDTLAELLGVDPERRADLPADTTPETTEAAFTSYLRGLGYLQRFDQPGALDAAIAAFEQATAEDPSFGAAHAGLCEALWDKFRLTAEPLLTEAALASCRRAGEVAEGDPAVLVSIGRIYFEKGEYMKAEAELQVALEIDPGRAEAYRWLGWVHARRGRAEQAEEALRRAIELEPRLWSYYNDLAQMLWGVGAYEKAAALSEEALQLTPQNHIVHNVLGVSRENLDQVAEAERLYRRSAELQPNPMAYRNLGLLYFREQQYQRAVEELERARDLIPESPSFNDWVVWSWLAHAYYWAGEREKAEASWRRLIELATARYEVNSRDPVVLTLLAEAHVALGELEQGRYYLDRLVAQPIDAVLTLYYIGRIYEMVGERDVALSYLERALEGRFDPTTIDRDPWLEELRQEPRYQLLRQQFVVSSPSSPG